MKVTLNQPQGFQPVVIILEDAQELAHFRYVLNKGIVESIGSLASGVGQHMMNMINERVK